MKEKLIIFGAGEWGRMAYYYYKDKCTIDCFLDNAPDLWGKTLNGIKVCNPQILEHIYSQDTRIVIANKRNSERIFEQLHVQFGVSECIFFKVETIVEEYKSMSEKVGIGDECIIKYMGGLGNQMFQYALAKCLQKEGYNVTGDLSEYYKIEEKRNFTLQNAFPDVFIKKCNDGLKKYYRNEQSLYIVEESVLTTDEKEKTTNIFKLKRGYFDGYWQNYDYIEKVEEELRKEFRFNQKNDQKLQEMARKILLTENTVSVHIRRGDYLERRVSQTFGNICTDDYYSKAIELIQDNIGHPFIIFFSNDIQWVKGKYSQYDAVFISEDMFDDYEDWYDIFLMSCCKHNIIANSTFSWWGAWLNSNENKIVVAPSKWKNSCETFDICPKEWVRI